MFVVFLYCFPMLLFLRVCRKCLLHIKIEKIKNKSGKRLVLLLKKTVSINAEVSYL